MKKRVLILGSKPDALIDEFDIAYCANASGYFYKQQLREKNAGDKLITIVAASELTSIPTRVSADKERWQAKRINAIHSLTDHHLKIISSEYFPEVVSDMGKYSLFKSVELIPHNKYEEFISRNGMLYPIITAEHLTHGSTLLKELVKYVIEYSKYKLRDKYLVNALYRQGTGIICLIEAIMQYGHDASYTIAGIGFNNRNRYEGGDINTWTPSSKINRNHVLADKKLVHHLAEIYEIDYFKS